MSKPSCFPVLVLALLILLTQLIIQTLPVQGLRINEVMYDPLGSDNNKEFVEIFGTDNLSGYILGDLTSNDSLELIKFVPGNFSLIVEEGFNYTNINCSVYSVGASIGNNLNNDADKVFLYYNNTHNNTLVDFMEYNGSLANNNGYSLELVNGSWKESCEPGGSPGKENCMIMKDITNKTINNTNATNTVNTTVGGVSEEEKNKSRVARLRLEIIMPRPLILGVVYDSLFKITNLNHVPGVKDSVFVRVKYTVTKNNSLVKEDYFNKTINYYSSANTGSLFFKETADTGNYTLCGFILNTSISTCRDFVVINPARIPCFIKLNLSTDKEVYYDNEKVKIKNIISNKSFPFIIEYWVEDLFGEEVKKRYNTTNTNQKTYTPMINEKDRVFIVKNRLVFVGCNNTNTHVENEKMIVIKKEKPGIEKDKSSESSISIDHVYLPSTGFLRWGDDFKVKLSIHKGDTTRSMIKVYVRDDNRVVSEELRFYLNKKNADYNFTVRVMLKQDCEQEFQDGYYYLVVEGLGKRAGTNISIRGNKEGVCKQEVGGWSGRIISFYTRSRNFKENISLYANINVNRVGSYHVVLMSRNEKQRREINSSSKIKFVVEPDPGLNLFVLELRKDEKIVDTKTLLVKLEGGKEAHRKDEPGLEEELLLEKSTGMVEEGAGFKGGGLEEPGRSINYSLMPLTGRIVYESNNMKIIRYLPYLLSLVLTIIIVGLTLSKRR